MKNQRIINKKVNFDFFLKPKNYIFISNKLFIPITISLIGLFIGAIYLGFFKVEGDFQQGEYYRIIYIHVPSAWICILLYSLLAIMSFIFLIYKNIFFYLIAKISAQIGIKFTILTLITGSLWGKPTWGTYWVWDARLTSVLILFFLYLGYIILDMTLESRPKAMNHSSLLAILGFLNIPIIKYSVDWWNTLHQASSITINYNRIDEAIWLPLWLSFLGLSLYVLLIFMLKLRRLLILKKIETFKTF